MRYRRHHKAARRLKPSPITDLTSKPLSCAGILLLNLHVLHPSLLHLNPSLRIQELRLLILRTLKSTQNWPNPRIRSILGSMNLRHVQNGISLNHIAIRGRLLSPRLLIIIQFCDSKSSLIWLRISHLIKLSIGCISIAGSWYIDLWIGPVVGRNANDSVHSGSWFSWFFQVLLLP